jgi:hypothetical protein
MENLPEDADLPEVGDDEDSVREWYPIVLKAIDQDDENPDQYLEYLEDE